MSITTYTDLELRLQAEVAELKAELAKQEPEPAAEVVYIKESGFPEIDWNFDLVNPWVGMRLYTKGTT